MQFQKYPKMSEKVPEAPPHDILWFVSEKIHGCNVSFYCDGAVIKVAKRTGFVDDPSKFFNYSTWLQKNEAKIFALQRKLSKNIIIYGELFGGWYPERPETWKGPAGVRIGPDNKYIGACSDRAIQEGVYYCSHNEFCAFDLAVDGELIPYSVAYEHFRSVKLLCVQPLVIGKFARICDFSPIFDSTIPTILGMKQLPKGTNYAEGVVIRPYNVASPGCAYKSKHPDYREVKQTFSGKYESGILKYTTQNRYNSVISKYGPSEKPDIVKDAFVADVFEAYYENETEPIRDHSLATQLIQKAFDQLIAQSLDI